MEKPRIVESDEGAILPFLFGGTLLISAVLLFSVQPLVGKLLLPLLGGAPAVWNTVMVFFQAMLLAGYAYAHFSFQKLGKFQPVAHLALLILAAVQLPFAIRAESVLDASHPALWVLLTLTVKIGLPVFVLASTAPLLQRWFATTRHKAAGDPYFLYAASNLGSFGALFAYPLVIEPFLPLKQQVWWWSIGFAILAGSIALTAVFRRAFSAPEAAPEDLKKQAAPIERKTILKWVGLSFVPSSLMLGVTSYITTDVASVPLLWVVPLGLYLFTFVIAFSNRSKSVREGSSRAIPILALAVAFPMLVQATEPVVVLVLLHILFFFFAALQCHLKLASGRPPAAQLTQFYLYMSLGGVLGGVFNALIAPMIFSAVIEYPLMILAATLIGFPERALHKPKYSVPPVYGGAIIVLVLATGSALITIAGARSVTAGNILAGLLLLGSFFFIRRPVRYTLALGTLLLCTSLFRQAQNRVIERERNFFGVLRVANDSNRPVRRLYHGTTIHGIQFTLPERRCEPLSYYHTKGPVGEISALFENLPLPRKVGLVGLGAGAMVSYSKPGQEWTIYEIDPAVIRVARDPRYFTFLRDCAQATMRFEVGDARLKLQHAPEGEFGLLYIDAFSSDVIPMHLLTVEAVRLYREKVAANGILAFHLSSRNFELEPLVANLGQTLGLHCFLSVRGELDSASVQEGGLESVWAILVTDETVPAVLAQGTWLRVPPNPAGPIWTDDFSSLLGVLRF